MSDIEDKIAKYLMIEDDGPADEMDDEDAGDLVFDMMVDLLSSIDPDSLSEFQADMLGNILDEVERIDDEEDDSEDEEDDVSEKRIQKISRKEHITLKKDYKRNKAKFKLMNKMFRKTSAFKVWKKKHKRLVKAGRTKTKKYV